MIGISGLVFYIVYPFQCKIKLAWQILTVHRRKKNTWNARCEDARKLGPFPMAKSDGFSQFHVKKFPIVFTFRSQEMS